MAQCEHHTDDTRCGMPARLESTLCINHDPGYRETQRQNSTAGGIASGESRRAINPTDLDFLSFTNRSEIQAALDYLFRMEILGTLPRERSRMLVRILALAVRNFDPPEKNHRGEDVYVHEQSNYDYVATGFAKAFEAMHDAMRTNDMQARYDTVQLDSARRTQRFRDEDDFGRTPGLPPFRQPRNSAEAWADALETNPPDPDAPPFIFDPSLPLDDDDSDATDDIETPLLAIENLLRQKPRR